jgi:hypothetical protein
MKMNEGQEQSDEHQEASSSQSYGGIILEQDRFLPIGNFVNLLVKFCVKFYNIQLTFRA